MNKLMSFLPNIHHTNKFVSAKHNILKETKEITFCSYSTKRLENSAPQVQALKNWNIHQIHLNGY